MPSTRKPYRLNSPVIMALSALAATAMAQTAESQRVAAQANMKSTVELLRDPRRQCPFNQVQARISIRAADIGELAAIQEEFRARPR